VSKTIFTFSTTHKQYCKHDKAKRKHWEIPVISYISLVWEIEQTWHVEYHLYSVVKNKQQQCQSCQAKDTHTNATVSHVRLKMPSQISPFQMQQHAWLNLIRLAKIITTIIRTVFLTLFFLIKQYPVCQSNDEVKFHPKSAALGSQLSNCMLIKQI